MNFYPAGETMSQSEDGVYQISRSPKPEGNCYIYRAWHRPTNKIITTISVYDEPAERAAAQAHCESACEVYAEAARE